MQMVFIKTKSGYIVCKSAKESKMKMNANTSKGDDLFESVRNSNTRSTQNLLLPSSDTGSLTDWLLAQSFQRILSDSDDLGTRGGDRSDDAYKE